MLPNLHELPRQEIERVIDELIEHLDELDGDPDVEPYLTGTGGNDPGGDDREGDDPDFEPSLGSIESHPNKWSWGRDSIGHQLKWSAGADDDREDEHDGREPDVDEEWSLGASEALPYHERVLWKGNWHVHSPNVYDQTKWAHGASDDHEPNGDEKEPWLGWTAPETASGRYSGTDEREKQCEDEGDNSDSEPDRDNEGGCWGLFHGASDTALANGPRVGRGRETAR